MVSNLTRSRLRDAAIRNGLGGNTKSRKEFSIDELNELASKFMEKQMPFWSPLTGKTFENQAGLLSHLSTYMDTISLLSFQLLIEPKNCKFCEVGLSRDTWQITKENKISPYCTTCYDKKMWKTKESHNKHGIYYGDKISKSKKEFYQTDRGTEVKASIGAKNSQHMKAFYATEEGKKYAQEKGALLSVIMSQKILAGEFTPVTKNRRTHWSATINLNGYEYKFRSSWEACVWLCNPTWEYESLRIPYFDPSKKKTRVYLCDFIDHTNKTVYEVKPVAFIQQFQPKRPFIEEWCSLNQYLFVIISEENIMNYIDTTKFDCNNIDMLNRLRRGIHAYHQYHKHQEN
jgi:hypothetical protein